MSEQMQSDPTTVEQKTIPDTTTTTPAVDYKAEHQKLQEQLKQFEGVDLEKWSKAKDFDLDKVERALELQDRIEREEREAQEAKDKEASERDPITGIRKEVDGIKQTLAQKEAAEKQRQTDAWMDRFDKSIESSIESALKSDFKELEELSPQEKNYVVTMVNNLYEIDSTSKTPKLNLTTVQKVVSEVIKGVQENRTFVLGRKIKGQGHPVTPGAEGAALPSGAPKTQGQRLEAMVNFYKGGREGQV